MFLEHVGQLAGGLEQAAFFDARSLRHSLAAAGRQACNGSFTTEKIKDFMTGCARALQMQVPLKGSVSDDSCHGTPSSETQSARWLACTKAVEAIKPQQLAAEACRMSQEPPVIR